MALARIEQLLQQRMGLHSATVGSSTVEKAVEQRMRDCGIDSIAAYEQVLNHSATELDALIDTVIIPETWFFRDRNPFVAFGDWVSNEWLPRNEHKKLRILSVPCSTGEEPYTLAMCLADRGIPAGMAEIDAVDISSSNIESANRGVYGNNSFRGNDLGFRDRYFTFNEPRYQINPEIKSRVSFAQANVLDSAFIATRDTYQVIFCRNLLIYFDRPTQHRAIDRLEQLLDSKGVLFLGHSETSLLLDREFTALDHSRSFGFLKGRKPSPRTSPVQPPGGRRPAAKRQPPRAPKTPQPAPFAGVQKTAGKAPADAASSHEPDLLKQAFKLADQGHLDEAAQHCESLLRQQIHQADAHFLLGLIREAAGSSNEAEQMFRKAIYLDPNHVQALSHLGIIYDKQGNTASAQRFKQRAERAAARSQVEETVE